MYTENYNSACKKERIHIYYKQTKKNTFTVLEVLKKII